MSQHYQPQGQPQQHTQYQQPAKSQGQPAQQTPTQQTQHSPTQQPQQLQQPQQWEGTLTQSLSQEKQLALQQFFEAEKVCEWCAQRCADHGQEMAMCLRLCRDVANIASLNATFVARDSPYADRLVQLFIDTASECAQECSQHSHAHCQDCARVLGQAIEAAQTLSQSLGSPKQPLAGTQQTVTGSQQTATGPQQTQTPAGQY